MHIVGTPPSNQSPRLPVRQPISRHRNTITTTIHPNNIVRNHQRRLATTAQRPTYFNNEASADSPSSDQSVQVDLIINRAVTTSEPIGHSELDERSMESTCSLTRQAYIAGDTIQGHIEIKSRLPIDLKECDIKLVGEGVTQYFHAKYRALKLCDVKVATVDLKQMCIQEGKNWKVPFSVEAPDDLLSSFDSGKKGRVRYSIVWSVECVDNTIERFCEEVHIYSSKQFDTFPYNEVCGNNKENEEYDNMNMELYTPVGAYLPGDVILFRAEVTNNGKRPVKKLAVLLLQNVQFFKSGDDQDSKGRTRSFLMSFKEHAFNLIQNQTEVWEQEIQIPDPVAPSDTGFHQICYELVLVAINKGKKSSIRSLFDEARYHFDLESYSDGYFRDFLPHAQCNIHIASLHGDIRSPYMYGRDKIRSLDEEWREKTTNRNQLTHIPKTQSDVKMARFTVNP